MPRPPCAAAPGTAPGAAPAWRESCGLAWRENVNQRHVESAW
jgi:hypothetical protein